MSLSERRTAESGGDAILKRFRFYGMNIKNTFGELPVILFFKDFLKFKKKVVCKSIL